MRAIGDGLGDVSVRDADGKEVELGEFADKPLLVIGVRYYGCLPCLEFMQWVNEVYDDICEAGAEVIAVGTGADFQARHLMESGTRFTCLVDPERRLYREIGAGRLRLRSLLDKDNYRNYYRALRRGRAHQGKMAGDHWQLPFIAALDAESRLTGLHLGQSIGDYPPLDKALSWVGVEDLRT